MTAPAANVVTDQMICVICHNECHFRWTDTHGIGACVVCGAPYRIIHYDEKNKRVNNPPECTIKPEWMKLLRQYWDETHRNVYPGAHNFPGSSYEVATEEDFKMHNEWLEVHKAEWPS